MSPAEGALRQGEIITSVVDHQVSLETLQLPEGGLRVDKRRHSHAIVLTQDCDLDWDYKAQRRILRARNKTNESYFPGLSVGDSASCEYALYLVHAGHGRHQISLPGALSAP